MVDPYRVLGVEPTATLLEIARARRALAKRHHPDLVRGDAAAARMRRINEAWTLLSDPATRAAWDRAHLAHAMSDPPMPTWTEWAYAPRPRDAAERSQPSRPVGWWILGATVLLLVLIVVGGIVSTLDRPADFVNTTPWLQENLDR